MTHPLFDTVSTLVDVFVRESARQAANDVGYIFEGELRRAEQRHEAAKGALETVGRGRMPSLKQVASPRGAANARF